MKKIHIGLNGSMLDEHPTGVGVYSYNLINNLSGLLDDRQQLTVFTPNSSHLNRNLRIIKLSGLLQSSRYGKIAAVCRFLWNTFLYPLQGRRFDLLISPTTHGSFFLKNQIITIHDLLSLRFNNISRHQRIYFKYLLPWMVSRARLIITVSETTKQDVIKLLNCPAEKIKVIYNGYDQSMYYQADERGEQVYKMYGVRNYLLAVGPTYPHKNFETLLKAYKETSSAFRQSHPLAIAGGMKKYVDGLKELVKELALNEHVHFLGYVPKPLMPAMYREAFALIFPSLYEGFGFPLLEAMACGCPVIASNCSSIPEVCAEAALYFDPLDTTSICNTMEKLSVDDMLRRDLITKGIQRAGQFSWEQTALAYKQIIDNQIPKKKFYTHV